MTEPTGDELEFDAVDGEQASDDDEAMEQTTHLLTFLEEGFYDN